MDNYLVVKHIHILFSDSSSTILDEIGIKVGKP